MKVVNFEVKTNKTIFWKEVVISDYYFKNGHPDYESLDNDHRNEDYKILQDLKKDLDFNETISSFSILK